MSDKHGMRSRGNPRLRRTKPTTTSLFQEYSGRDLSSKPKRSMSSSTDAESPAVLTPGSLLRIWLKPPWDDYASPGSERDDIVLISTAITPVLVCHRRAYFRMASIRAFQTSGGVKILQDLSSIQHPNIASIYDVYLYDDKVFIVSEYLEFSLAELDFHSFPFEEWEIATVANEVLKGLAYLSFKGLSCKALAMSHIRISTEGLIKIVLDMQQYERQADQTSRQSHAILDLPCMADMVQEMMLPRYHLKDSDESWSPDALNFLTCCLSGSIRSLIAHVFLAQAKSPSRLAPRIRLAAEVLRLEPSGRSDSEEEGF